MTTRQFLRIAMAMIVLAIGSILGGSSASAQCNCQNTVTVDPNAPCCIRALDIQVYCDDGSQHPFDPGAGPFTSYCQGSMTPSPCPCPNSTDGVIIDIGGGTFVTIPVGRTRDIRYLGDCCLRITVTQSAHGCIDINVSAAPLC